MNKKRERKSNNDYLDDDILDEEKEINEINENQLFNFTFLFSCILPDYFLMIKNLIMPNFILENISLSGLTDLIINMREDVGTTLQVENDEEKKIFGVFTLIPFNYYSDNPVVNQLKKLFIEKSKNSVNYKEIAKIINTKSLGIIINERYINCPEQLIPPAMKFIIKEVNECIEIAQDEKNIKEINKYDLDYVILYSRYIQLINDKDKNFRENNNDKFINIDKVSNEKNKKRKLNNDISSYNKNYFKYETPLFLNKSDFYFDYKLTGGIYDSNICFNDNKENIENEYMTVIFIKFNKFSEIINNLN